MAGIIERGVTALVAKTGGAMKAEISIATRVYAQAYYQIPATFKRQVKRELILLSHINDIGQ